MINISDTLEEENRKQSEKYLKTIKNLMLHDRMSYWIGNPSVQIISGQLFLKKFKEPQQTISIQQYVKNLKELNMVESVCLVILGLPTCIRPLEIWQSLAETQEFIQQCRVIKTEETGYYSLLIRLLSLEHCQEFYYSNFGRKINQLEPHLILFRQISQITIQFDEFVISQKTQLQIFRRKLTHQIHPVDSKNIFMTYTIDKSSSNSAFVCAICFQDMMASTSGILSILCGHYFHQNCLSKWNENTCPLCRYHQQPPTLSFCQSCNNNQSLWMCLVCGKKLCTGNNEDLLSTNSHIYEHYKQTEHSIAMEIQSKFVYQFSLKDFLHRVYFNQKTRNPDAGIQPKYKKSADLIKQYENVAMVEMEEQRKYFQKKVASQKKTQKQIIQNLLSQIGSIREQNDRLTTQYDQQAQQKQIVQLQLQLKTCQKYHSLLASKLKSIQSKLSKQTSVQESQIKKIDQSIIQKREQIKDIQQNITANSKIKKKLKGQKISQQFFMKK